MKDLSNCPKCNDPLENTFLPKGGLRKVCRKRPDHQFTLILDNSKDVSSVGISLSMVPLIRAVWQVDHQRCIVMEGTIEEIVKNNADENPTILPYWEPDFSNWEELVRKVRTYVTFS